MPKIQRWTVHVLIAIAATAAVAVAQQPGFRERSAAAEKNGLAQPFNGVTTDGTKRAGLYSIASTGVTTGPVRKAAEAFLAGLTPALRAKTMFPIDDDEWRKWMNQHFYVRQGVGFLDMTPAQQEL